MYKYCIKPLFDFIMALLGIIILSPVFLILIIAIKINSKGPILFKQNRVGKNKKLFKIYKFRTMRIDTPKDMPTHLLENPEQYITKVGKFLRKTSLDELPQIINILFGKMSIIGPRPALWNQEDLIIERDKYNANSIKPGLTGWAQVNGRDEIEIKKKAELDGEYVKKRSFLFDLKIFFKTIAKVFKRDGVVEGGTGTLEHQSTRAPEQMTISEVLTEDDTVQAENCSAEIMESFEENSAKYQEQIADWKLESEEEYNNEESFNNRSE